MKKNKRLDPIIESAVKASFKDRKLLGFEVSKLNNTFKKLPQTEAIYIISGYLKGVKREIAKTTLTVESAIPLSKTEVLEIKKYLKILTTNEQLTINPQLLGGIRARIGDTVYDLSIKGKLEQVKEAIRG